MLSRLASGQPAIGAKREGESFCTLSPEERKKKRGEAPSPILEGAFSLGARKGERRFVAESEKKKKGAAYRPYPDEGDEKKT